MKTIELTRGYEAIVDDDDYSFLSQFKWSVSLARYNRPYALGRIGKGRVLMQRALLGLTDRNTQVSFKNGNGLDCRRDNLRIASISQVRQWTHTKGKNSKSHYRGVGKVKGGWSVHANHVYIGFFSDEFSAALAYDQAARAKFGQFASPNYIVT